MIKCRQRQFSDINHIFTFLMSPPDRAISAFSPSPVRLTSSCSATNFSRGRIWGARRGPKRNRVHLRIRKKVKNITSEVLFFWQRPRNCVSILYVQMLLKNAFLETSEERFIRTQYNSSKHFDLVCTCSAMPEWFSKGNCRWDKIGRFRWTFRWFVEERFERRSSSRRLRRGWPLCWKEWE